MVLDEIVLHNFGVYLGRQTIQLAPPSKDRPIVLIGGLNGGGKTTLIDSLQLALFGPLARCSNRGTEAYEEFLRRSIHHSVSPKEGAAVELQFRFSSRGEQETIRIHRSWHENGRGVREKVEVLRNDQLDQVLTDAWAEHSDQFLPAGLAHLFFFDGEKIASLADPHEAAALLSTGIHSLLGIDLLDRLDADLLVLERKKRAEIPDDPERDSIDAKATELAQLEAKRDELAQRCGECQLDVDRAELLAKALEDRYRREGGEALMERDQIERQRTNAQIELAKVEDELRDLAMGPAPFLLLGGLMGALAKQGSPQSAGLDLAALSQLLQSRDDETLGVLRAKKAPRSLLTAIAAHLEHDRTARTRPGPSAGQPPSAEPAGLTALINDELPQAKRQIGLLLDRAAKLEHELNELDRKLAAAPDPEVVASLGRELFEARMKRDEARAKRSNGERELAEVREAYDRTKAQLASRVEGALAARFEHEDLGRVLRTSQRVRSTVGSYRRALVERNTHRIESLILDSLRQLLRKAGLVRSLQIDPATYRLRLFGHDERPVDPDRLSAGERQLLAVAMLWGLARSASRPLPAVIDTPLGRLDSTHRQHLVERYFPKASHQVILLSTDEEIDENYAKSLRPAVGRSYRLEYDEATSATRVEPGYFW